MRRINFRNNLGMLLLAIWLIVSGVLALLPVQLGQLGIIVPLLALAAGVLLLLGR
jgi:hypothetical protein